MGFASRLFIVVCLLVVASQAGQSNTAVVPKTRMRSEKQHSGPGTVTKSLCVQVPIPKPYPCEKEEEVERSYPCDKKIEREICEYVQQSTNEECFRLKSEIAQFSCYTVKKEEVCWNVPQQKQKKCKKVVKKQQEIESERTVRREVCEQKSYGVNSTCYRQEQQTMAYMCYKPQARTCSTVNVPVKGICKKLKTQKKAHPCEKKTVETVCTSTKSGGNSHNNYYPHDQSQQRCRQQEVVKKSTCYTDVQVEVEEACDRTQVKRVCETPKPKPDTCEKALPTLKTYGCKSTRHREVCRMGEVHEKTIDYIDQEEEEEYDCPYIEEAKKCVTYETVVPDVCEKEIQKVEKYPCPKALHKEVCHIKPTANPHTCYSVDKVTKNYTCYDVDYKMECYNVNGSTAKTLQTPTVQVPLK